MSRTYSKNLAHSQVGLFFDGIPVIKFGDFDRNTLLQFFALARKQLQHDGRPNFHFPSIIGGEVALQILNWAQQARSQTNPPAFIFVPSFRETPQSGFAQQLDSYIGIICLGVTPRVLFDNASALCASILSLWRTFSKKHFSAINDSFAKALQCLPWDLNRLWKDPVFFTIAYTFTYGLLNSGSAFEKLQHRFQNDCPTLWQSMQAIKTTSYSLERPIQRLAAGPTLLKLSRPQRTTETPASTLFVSQLYRSDSEEVVQVDVFEDGGVAETGEHGQEGAGGLLTPRQTPNLRKVGNSD